MIYCRKEDEVFHHMVMTKTKTYTKYLKDTAYAMYIFGKQEVQGYQISHSEQLTDQLFETKLD